jgi:Sulfotransferase family
MKIFYLHIPKTGGQTLAARLASAYAPGKADFIGEDLNGEQGEQTLRSMLAEKDFVERHVGSNTLANFKDADIICTVRDPVAHRISVYQHVLRGKENLLHQAATQLPPREFFSKFWDLLTDQTRYLVGAFTKPPIDLDRHRHSVRHMYDCLDRIRWLVPTECIDEFSMLWSMETGKHIPFASHMQNVAPHHEKYDELVRIVESMPGMYAADALLWQIAKERFDDYRRLVLSKVRPFPHEVDSGTSFLTEHGSGIWLLEGWHLPQYGTPMGTAWWAGPQKFSRVHVRRVSGERYLQVSIIVVCGVPHDRILAVSKDGSQYLPQACVQVSDERWELTVDLAQLAPTDEFLLATPFVGAPIMFSQGSSDTERKSFATCNWTLLDHVSDGLELLPRG